MTFKYPFLWGYGGGLVVGLAIGLTFPGSKMDPTDKYRYALKPFADFIPKGVPFDPASEAIDWTIFNASGEQIERRVVYMEDFLRARDILILEEE
jgi:hypothetical protein